MQHNTLPTEIVDGLVSVLGLIRSGAARTRPELVRASGLGRSVVTERVARLLEQGVVVESGTAPSTGGRAARELALSAHAGVILVAPLGAGRIRAGVTDLSGRLLTSHEEPMDIALGPSTVLGRVHEVFGKLLADLGPTAPVWGVGVGLPGPVEFASGRPMRPPIMPGWHDADVRGWMAERYDVPVWVDNDVNLMALGELKARGSSPGQDMIFVKVGTGIGAGLVSRGELHRGAKGCAGDIGHVEISAAREVVCRCGNIGCLEAHAGGGALVRRALEAVNQGRSPYLARILEEHGQLKIEDIARGGQEGDGVSVELLMDSGRLLGQTLATLVNFFDPHVVVLGGVLGGDSDPLLAAVRETVYRRSLPLATRDLFIERTGSRKDPSLVGVASMVLDELFSRDQLSRWLEAGSPRGLPVLPRSVS
ncbi:ROK family protein [Cellulomonas fimi]|uniref:ROK family protein n=1 Tax=Cellulomonas fimi TaxID=1708 RepID=A0A7Y0M0W8_CELFI|nr:ROK family protein [Cellulomonas fimi]NMR21485.1 ROK family protein [Cellulomonas fimi]